jgi:hypothetical protein
MDILRRWDHCGASPRSGVGLFGKVWSSITDYVFKRICARRAEVHNGPHRRNTWREQGRGYLVSVNVGKRKEIYDDYLVSRKNVKTAENELPDLPPRWVHTEVTRIIKDRTAGSAGTTVSRKTHGRKTSGRRSYTGR